MHFERNGIRKTMKMKKCKKNYETEMRRFSPVRLQLKYSRINKKATKLHAHRKAPLPSITQITQSNCETSDNVIKLEHPKSSWTILGVPYPMPTPIAESAPNL